MTCSNYSMATKIAFDNGFVFIQSMHILYINNMQSNINPIQHTHTDFPFRKIYQNKRLLNLKIGKQY